MEGELELPSTKTPEVPLSGRCEDCRTMRAVTIFGTCEACGSGSVWRPGGVASLAAAIRFTRAFDACWRH